MGADELEGLNPVHGLRLQSDQNWNLIDILGLIRLRQRTASEERTRKGFVEAWKSAPDVGSIRGHDTSVLERYWRRKGFISGGDADFMPCSSRDEPFVSHWIRS